MSDHPRYPLVFARQNAREEAARVIPGRDVENEETAAIAHGRIAYRRREGFALVFCDGFTARVREARSPTTGRKCWLILSVETTVKGRTRDNDRKETVR